MKIIHWVDPYTNKPLEENEGFLINEESKYPIINGVPKFVKEAPDQNFQTVSEICQISSSFLNKLQRGSKQPPRLSNRLQRKFPRSSAILHRWSNSSRD